MTPDLAANAIAVPGRRALRSSIDEPGETPPSARPELGLR
jgi:hypothetical protein